MNDEFKLTKAALATSNRQALAAANPWSLKISDAKDEDFDSYADLIDECRFFYRYDPLVSTVTNKLVDIGVEDLLFSQNGLSDNEFRAFLAMKPKLLQFAEDMALEYLISGLVVPEISYGYVGKEEIKDAGIKKYDKLVFPISLFVRDPKTIKISTSLLTDQPTYLAMIPKNIIDFIMNNGKYPNGVEDKELFENIKKYFPDFYSEIKKGSKEIKLENKNIIRRRYTTNNAYPIPYITASIDSLKHKRQLRQMDFSIANKVIGAIMHVKVGSDDFPITNSEEDVEYVENLRGQLNWRFNNNKDLERIFQLLTSHTVDINWVFPDTKELLNESKYKDINQEILFGLGFPRILITGETERSGSSDPQMALTGPIKTMEGFRRKIASVIRRVCWDISQENGFKNAPEVEFAPINLHKFEAFVDSLGKLYEFGGLSRETFAKQLGVDFRHELENRSKEQIELDKLGLSPVGQSPHGGVDIQKTDDKPKDKKNEEKVDE